MEAIMKQLISDYLESEQEILEELIQLVRYQQAAISNYNMKKLESLNSYQYKLLEQLKASNDMNFASNSQL